MKNKSLVLLLILSMSSVACSSKGIDGNYQRIDQTDFEKEKGMSSGLVISNEGKQVKLQNAWGDVDLTVVENNNQAVIQYLNQDAFIMKKTKRIVTLTDVDNPNQVFKFQEN